MPLNNLREGSSTGLRTGGLNNLSSPYPIPSSGLLHDYDASSFNLADGDTISSDWSDSKGSSPMSPTGDPTYRTGGFNNNPYIELDGANDGFSGTATFTQPFYAIVVIYPSGNLDGESHRILSNGTNVDDSFTRVDGYRIRYTLSGTTVGPEEGYPNEESLHTLEGDQGNTRYRVDGTDQLVGDSGGGGFEDMSVGYRVGKDDKYLQANIARILVYDKENSPSLSDIESNVAGKYDITI